MRFLSEYQKYKDGKNHPYIFGAGKSTWTFTEEPRLEPESSASANSAISAYEVIGKSE